MRDLNFKLRGLTERHYRRWRRSGPSRSGAASALLPLAITAATVYVLTTTVDTILWALIESPVAEVRLSGASIAAAGPDGGRFQFSVSPLDPDGKLISLGLDRRNFAFSPISIAPADDPGNVVASGIAAAKDVDVLMSRGGRRLKVLLLFDSSGSMANNDPQGLRIAAGERFVRDLAPAIEAAVMDFKGLRQDFTTEPLDLLEGIASIGAEGGTPLFGKLKEGLTKLGRADADHRALVVLTDGIADDASVAEVVDAAKTSGTQIVAVGLGRGVDFSDLELMAEETGGSFLRIGQAQQLGHFFDAVSTSIAQGRVVVVGEVSFEPRLTPGKNYVVSGDLLTEIGGVVETTPFRLVTEIGRTHHFSEG